jgi:transposase InsO family protein
MNSFKSERIEGYLWAWMKMYYEQLKNRRKKVNNNGFILNK